MKCTGILSSLEHSLYVKFYYIIRKFIFLLWSPHVVVLAHHLDQDHEVPRGVLIFLWTFGTMPNIIQMTVQFLQTMSFINLCRCKHWINDVDFLFFRRCAQSAWIDWRTWSSSAAMAPAKCAEIECPSVQFAERRSSEEFCCIEGVLKWYFFRHKMQIKVHSLLLARKWSPSREILGHQCSSRYISKGYYHVLYPGLEIVHRPFTNANGVNVNRSIFWTIMAITMSQKCEGLTV